MKAKVLAPVALAFSISAVAPAFADNPVPVPGAPETFADVIAKVQPGTVFVMTKTGGSTTAVTDAPASVPPGTPESPFERFFRGLPDRQGPGQPQPQPEQPRMGSGSGFVVDGDECLIVTNNHVVASGTEYKVQFPTGKEYTATLVGTDADTDLAVLKCDATEAVPEVAFGNSGAMRVGDWVVALGSPFGITHTVTAGIVSALGRQNSGPYDDFIQTDAPINLGNSGGALVNMKGEVIGINSQIFSPVRASIGIGYAIPSNLAKDIVVQLIDHGTVERGWLGVRMSGVTDEDAANAGLDRARGAKVASVTAGSPAEAAGVQQGDIIIEANGVVIEDPSDLARTIGSMKPGEEAAVTFKRGDVEMSAAVRLGDRKAAPAATEAEPEKEGEAPAPGPGEMPNPGMR